jgi:hypothetical protein
MKPKGLLIAVAVLAVLGGLTWWSNKKQAAASKSTTDTATKILSIPSDQVQEVRVKKPAETVDIKLQNGKWQLTQPEALPADSDAMTTMVSSLSSLNADKVVDPKATDLTPYGLQNPTLDVQIVKKDGKTDNLLVGDETPTGSGSYAKLANDGRVFTIASYVKTNFDKSPTDLRDKRLLTFDSDKLTRVELQANSQAVEFGKNNKNEWQILKPRAYRADGSQVDSLVTNLKDAKMDLSEDAKKAAEGFGGGTRVATATATDANGSQTLEIRKNKDTYYAKSSVVAGVYKLSGDGKGFEKKLDDFRNKKLFEFGFSDPTKIELKAATYTKSGDKWQSGAKTMDNNSVQNVIDKLRDLSATGFEEKAGGEPVFEAAVTSDMGKRVEKVAITKQGDKYFAKREDEPNIYTLDAKTVEELQKTASDVKEAAPPAPAKKK